MEIKDLKELSRLARIEIKDEELISLGKDFDSILAYVVQIQKITTHSTDGEPAVGIHHNVMRPDENPHEPGMYTEDIMKNMPDSQDGYLRVKKIL